MQEERTSCWSTMVGWLALRSVSLNVQLNNTSPSREMRFLAHPEPFVLHHLLYLSSLVKAALPSPSTSSEAEETHTAKHWASALFSSPTLSLISLIFQTV